MLSLRVLGVYQGVFTDVISCIQESCDLACYMKKKTNKKREARLLEGTGVGALKKELQLIPGFWTSTSHSGWANLDSSEAKRKREVLIDASRLPFIQVRSTHALTV